MEFLKTISDYIGYAVCHQIPEKSFIAFGEPVSLCARDQGIYLGFIVVFFYFFLKVLIKKEKPVELPSMPACFLLLSIALLMPLDAILQIMGVYFSNITRVFSGLAFGFGIAPFVIVLFSDSYFKKKNKKEILSSFELLLLLMTLILLGSLIIFGGDYLVFTTSVISITGFLILAVFICLIVVDLLLKKWPIKKSTKLIISLLLTALIILSLRYFHKLALKM